MPLVVQKFGGSSVADADRMRSVAEYIALTRRRGADVVVVVSAMGKETDALIRLADEIATRQPPREWDMLVTAGERKSMALLTMALHDFDCAAESFTGSQAGIVTDTAHTKARILEIKPVRIQRALSQGKVAVVGGAQGVSTDNDVTFLGRDASDITAVALAHALGADSCELYTDVSGVFTADPRLVPTAHRIPQLSFEEMLEMCGAGCPKPAMRSVEFARNYGVHLHVRSSFTWEPGTWIREEDPAMEQPIISAVVHDVSEAKVTVTQVPDQPGIAARLFRSLADRRINVDMIVQNTSVQGTTDISFTVPKADLASAEEVCRSHAEEIGAAEVTTVGGVAKVSLVGAGMKTNPGVSAQMFEVLAGHGINIEMISTSPIRITCVIGAERVEEAVVALHEAFELGA
jgi:aspartate kinase